MLEIADSARLAGQQAQRSYSLPSPALGFQACTIAHGFIKVGDEAGKQLLVLVHQALHQLSHLQPLGKNLSKEKRDLIWCQLV